MNFELNTHAFYSIIRFHAISTCHSSGIWHRISSKGQVDYSSENDIKPADLSRLHREALCKHIAETTPPKECLDLLLPESSMDFKVTLDRYCQDHRITRTPNVEETSG